MADAKRQQNNRRLLRYAGWAFVIGLAGVLGWHALTPKPLVVETASVSRGPMELTIDQQGEVRVHDRFTIAAPVAGRLVRVELHDGDPVRAGETVAELEVTPLDPRSRQEAVARLDAARALVREADQRVAQAEAELEQAGRELRRAERLVAEKFISMEAADKARTAERTAQAAVAAVRSRAAAARSDEQAAAAALLAAPAGGNPGGGRKMKLVSPVKGNVLRVLERSERTVAAGTPVMLIGDPTRFEVIADVLSTDAVKIKAGAPVRIEQWGGPQSLRGTVRVVEPYAFTKVSSLGIEEKRVNVVIDPVDGLGPLGDGYRVEARIVIWAADQVLKVPSSALFRAGEGWAVFVVDNGRAQRRSVEIGARSAREAELRSGLEEGATVINYPSNELRDEVRVVGADQRSKR